MWSLMPCCVPLELKKQKTEEVVANRAVRDSTAAIDPCKLGLPNLRAHTNKTQQVQKNVNKLYLYIKLLTHAMVEK